MMTGVKRIDVGRCGKKLALDCASWISINSLSKIAPVVLLINEKQTEEFIYIYI